LRELFLVVILVDARPRRAVLSVVSRVVVVVVVSVGVIIDVIIIAVLRDCDAREHRGRATELEEFLTYRRHRRERPGDRDGRTDGALSSPMTSLASRYDGVYQKMVLQA